MKRLTGLLIAVMLFFAPMQVSADSTEAERERGCCTALLEAQTGMLLGGEESDRVMPAGSQTKLMTVLLAAEAVTAGNLTPETLLTAPASAEGAKGASIWLKAGEKMSLTDLLKGVIIGNANDAALTIAFAVAGSEAWFVSEMNAEAFSLGLRNTRFYDCTGTSDGNVTTAYELGLICRALLEYEWLTPLFTTWRDFLRGEATELVNENRLTRTYEGILGMKAGHGDACGYTLTLAAERNSMRCIAVILGGSDPDARFSDAKTLLSSGFSGYTVTTPDFSAEFLKPVTVRHGMASAVLAESASLRAVAVPKRSKMSCVVILPNYIEAPVRAGDALGEIAFYCGDTLLYEAPLTAAADVPHRSFLRTFGLLLDNLFK